MEAQQKYIQFLVDSKFYSDSFCYGIAEDPSAYVSDGSDPVQHSDESYPVQKMKKVSDDECVTRYEMGFNTHLPINTEVVSTSTRSILFKISYFDTEYEFRVFCPLQVSPSDFMERFNQKVNEHFWMKKTGDPYFKEMKEFYVDKKKDLFKNFKLKKINVDETDS